MTVDLNKYQDFVLGVTSDESKDVEALIKHLRELNENVNIAHLLTAASGLSSEGGEFSEIVKKCTFQGKPLNEDTIYHMKRELGDVMFYVIQACLALDTNLDELIHMNVDKLTARYPDGFSVERSENRAATDI